MRETITLYNDSVRWGIRDETLLKVRGEVTEMTEQIRKILSVLLAFIMVMLCSAAAFADDELVEIDDDWGYVSREVIEQHTPEMTQELIHKDDNNWKKEEPAPKKEEKKEEPKKEEKKEEAPKKEEKKEEAPKQEEKKEEAPKQEEKQEEAPKQEEVPEENKESTAAGQKDAAPAENSSEATSDTNNEAAVGTGDEAASGDHENASGTGDETASDPSEGNQDEPEGETAEAGEGSESEQNGEDPADETAEGEPAEDEPEAQGDQVTVSVKSSLKAQGEMALTAVVNDPEGREYSYQWQVSEDGGQNFTDIENATTAEIEVLLNEENINNLWRVKVQAN